DDPMTTEDIVSRSAALGLSSTLAGAKLPSATPAAPPTGSPRPRGERPADATVPADITKDLKAAGWARITGQWKRVAGNTYEVTHGKLEADKVNGMLQLWVAKNGDGSVKAFVRNDQRDFPWNFFGKFHHEAFERGYGAWIKGQDCQVYLPLTATMG